MAVDCGALRPLGDGAAGVERTYVVPAARGWGLSRLVLPGLEAAARDHGWTTLRLQTGPRQPEVIALDEGVGYRPIAASGGYAHDAGDSLFCERELDRARPPPGRDRRCHPVTGRRPGETADRADGRGPVCGGVGP